jgi:hypothetical protein
MLYKNPVRTSKRTPHFTITKINWLTLFKEIIAVYTEKHKRLVTINAVLLWKQVAGVLLVFFFFPVPVCAITASGAWWHLGFYESF